MKKCNNIADNLQDIMVELHPLPPPPFPEGIQQAPPILPRPRGRGRGRGGVRRQGRGGRVNPEGEFAKKYKSCLV